MIDQQRIATIIIEKAQDLIKSLVPSITDITSKIGISNIGTPDLSIPDLCLPKNDLDKIVKLRDNLKEKLNSTADTIEKLSEPIGYLNKTITTTSAALLVLKTTRTLTKTAVKAIPSPPGAPGVIVSTLDDLKDLEEFLTPKVAIAQITITSIEAALDIANSILLKILSLFDIIDQYIKKCGGLDSPKNSNYLDKVLETSKQSNLPIDSVYKGFALEIVEEPYSPTVNRRQAVAKNNNGIILLKTPLSFTTNTKVLIEELKLIIDKSDLKAY